ncbi:MAG: hypothetical protein V1746_05200 [bacterium]
MNGVSESEEDKKTAEEKPRLDSRLFRWNAMAAPPWDPASYYFFLVPDPAVYEANLVAFTFEHASDLHAVLSHFCTAASYTGLNASAERVCGDLMLHGEESGTALLTATMAMQLVQQGIAHFLPEFLHVFIMSRPDENSTEEEANPLFAYPISPLHLWAFLQACDCLERDLLPIYEKNGEDIYPFGQIADVRKAVQSMRELLAKDVKTLMAGQNPYRQIADLRALGAMMEEEESKEKTLESSED